MAMSKDEIQELIKNSISNASVTIEDLRDIKCQIIEPRFGFFQILD